MFGRPPVPAAKRLREKHLSRSIARNSRLERIEQQEQREALNRALMRLEPDTRAIMVLRDMQGLDYEQIGMVFDVPIGTVKSRLFRARAALREQMEHEAGGRGV
jgi:RNA polymerase sigma factor (sigma-70 family)